MNYNYFRKEKFGSVEDLKTLEPYDCLISSHVEVDRVITPSQMIPYNELWWVKTDKDNLRIKEENVKVFNITEDSDDGITKTLLENRYQKLCIDITGFIIPKLLLLLRFLHIKGFRSVDIIYTEPNQYINDEYAQFSDTLLEVKQITGYAGQHISDMANDLLIIAAGYDHSRIIDVANAKKSANKVLLFGFPPSSPDMFQENILRAYQAESAVGSDCFKDLDMNVFAPANDPFMTAQALKEFMNHPRKKPFTNVYFSPISSKPQALGMALFYIWETGWKKEWSIIYPFCSRYNNDTSHGISRIWRYKIELPEYNQQL